MGGIWSQKKPIEERFFSKIEKTSTCWNWKAATHGNNNYGVFYDGLKNVAAHRYSYEFHIGKIKSGKIIMHTCDIPTCVNPNHLVQGTQKENIQDAVTKGRFVGHNGNRKRISFCKRGHAFIGENIYISPNQPEKGRRCKACKNTSRKEI